ncbi:ABC transporter substrate-binding protein [Ileibacterium valens]|uniref:ABC transporter substrate-binding protein n=1 Tax=Ileibacterium valens TaxID=1862668 RepID=UPI0025736D14|nr:ABC transporter substrate-binding protein [Ileibacterium valens]
MKSKKLAGALAALLAATSMAGCSGSGEGDAGTAAVIYGGSNYVRIVDEELNNALIAGKKTTDMDASIESYKKAFVKESELAPYLPIYGNHVFNIFKKGVNVTTGPVCNWSQALADASIDGGDTLVVGMTQELAGLFSPLYAISSYDQYVVNMVYQSLLAYDANSELYGQAAVEVPEAAEDGKSVTFKLREGLKFSDGSDLTAEDVKFTFTLAADPEYIGGRLDGTFDFIEGWDDYQEGEAEEVSGIVVDDDHTITFKLAEPDIDAVTAIGSLGILSSEQFPYSKGAMGEYKDNNSATLGSNAYKVHNYDKSSGASLVKNENYAGEGEFSIPKVVIKTVAASTELASLQNGDVNYYPELIEPGIIAPATKDDKLAYDYYFRAAEGYVGFNCADGPTADPAVRQALSYATDRQGFVDAFYDMSKAAEDAQNVGLGYVPTAFWSPVAVGMGDATTGTAEIEGAVKYDFDIEKAKQVLEEAGWVEGSDGIREKDGQKLTIKFLASEGNAVLDMLIPMIMDSWGQIGVDLQQSTVDFNTLIDTVGIDSVDTTSWSCFFMATSFTGLSNTSMNDLLGYTEFNLSE